MKLPLVEQQTHGYKYGHELLATSTQLDRPDQDAIDRLSDLSGPLRPGELFSPYLTAYPLPSGKFYVVARTWQDLKAPRAGCVLTRSLLIPVSLWEQEQMPGNAVKLLLPVERNEKSLQALQVSTVRTAIPPVDEPARLELIEALFFESRQPVVVFEAEDPELMSIRLLTALWPSYRRKFALCTHALSPRPLFQSRQFDLLFAPKTARSRFAEWTNRKIDGGNASRPRHRWTSKTARLIFENKVPSLVEMDALGALQSDRQGDEISLRLALLWDELVERSKESPTAALGLLDILNSQGTPFTRVARELTPLLERGVFMASKDMPTGEAWTFLDALLGKFSELRAPRSLIRHVKTTATLLTRAMPQSAIDFLSIRKDKKGPLSSVLAAGIGDGLTTGSLVSTADLEAIGDQALFRLLAFSRDFCRVIAGSVSFQDSHGPAQHVVQALNTADPIPRARIRRNFLPFINNREQAPLLKALLFQASPLGFASAVRRLWIQTHFQVDSFDLAFRSRLEDRESVFAVRDAILECAETDAAYRFLLSTLSATRLDIAWILEARIPNGCAGMLATAVFETADDERVRNIVRFGDLSDRLLAILKPLDERTALQAARVLIESQLDFERFCNRALTVLRALPRIRQPMLANAMVIRGLSEGAATANVEFLDSMVVTAVTADAPQLIHAATQNRVTWQQVNGSILQLRQLSEPTRAAIAAHIDVLTDCLVRLPPEGASPQAINAWASFLSEAGSVSPRTQQAASDFSLHYALGNPHLPLSNLIVVAFPVVYQRVREGREPVNFFEVFFFRDWDKCRTLRGQLVEAFVASDWPAGDLLLAAYQAGDAQAVLARLMRERRGEEYLSRIADDLHRFSDKVRKELAHELKKFTHETRR